MLHEFYVNYNQFFFKISISFEICITFDLFQNLVLITIYVGCVANLELFSLGCVKVRVLKIVCRFAVAKGELSRSFSLATYVP